MRPVILALSMALLFLAACAQQNENDRDVRGVLKDHGAIILTECGTGKVYWVRAADTLLFSLQRRVQDLSGETAAEIVAEIRGETIDVRTSVGTAYPVHGTLWISQIISVEPGEC
ncbi:MAG: hypothetical protein OEU09_01245 [Rhodospirillales bacterium]|nr:hypothetical protein [Rhodospirillales bacterium]MDH3909889.1 hypothetical protein [Rhodospirillales bacterium]MDH3918164.1 hypothetical protein [Rhodospirillales bacterium]MDH3967063.1 hypothetical protein [Rhodospirillales bacterium]